MSATEMYGLGNSLSNSSSSLNNASINSNSYLNGSNGGASTQINGNSPSMPYSPTTPSSLSSSSFVTPAKNFDALQVCLNLNKIEIRPGHIHPTGAGALRRIDDAQFSCHRSNHHLIFRPILIENSQIVSDCSSNTRATCHDWNTRLIIATNHPPPAAATTHTSVCTKMEVKQKFLPSFVRFFCLFLFYLSRSHLHRARLSPVIYLTACRIIFCVSWPKQTPPIKWHAKATIINRRHDQNFCNL